MDLKFWIKAWQDGRTAFNQQKYNKNLEKHFPSLAPQKGQKVFVPLCGKTKDLLYLRDLGLQVHGVELYEQAVKEFFAENNLPNFKKHSDGAFTHYEDDGIKISCGDFFKFNTTDAYDFIYDRAALVALPPEMRKPYVQILTKALRPHGRCLLVSYEYDQGTLEGPPFSIVPDEIHDLYRSHFNIKMLEREVPVGEGARLAAVESIRTAVYILEKTS
jgi:thiopurine S-methyltransferase